MKTVKLTLHVDVEVSAESLNLAKAVVEARAKQVACDEGSDTFGPYKVTFIGARAAVVKGRRQPPPTTE